MAVNAATAAEKVATEELAVLQAMAESINREASRPFERLYFESEFEGAPHVASSLANPDRTKFCGLSREEAIELVSTLQALSTDPVEIDDEVAKSAGLKIGHKKNPRFPYVILSRVVFGPGNKSAWVAVELNGSSGAVMRLDKVGGAWSKTARCGGWLKPED
ncbi:MAG TPA: hypothetical protein VIV63_02600 [Steroidobacteraceae bacterium]